MASLAETVTYILKPYLGHSVADTCVRATALSIGKTSDALDGEDLPALEANIQRVLAPVASRSTIEAIIAQIEEDAA